MSKRREYHREYYRNNSETLSDRKQEERDNFDQATTYWRQKMLFGGRSAVYPQADTPTTRQVFGTDYREEEDVL